MSAPVTGRLDALCGLVGAIVCPDTATAFRVLVERGEDRLGRVVVEASRLSAALGCDLDDLPKRLTAVEDVAARSLGFEMFDRRTPLWFEDAGTRPQALEPGPNEVLTSARMTGLLRDALPAAPAGGAPGVDAATMRWIGAVAVAREGHGFAALTVEGGPDMTDVASLVAARCPDRVRLVGEPVPRIGELLLRAELHAGVVGDVVVVAPSLLVADSATLRSDDEWDGLEPDGGGAEAVRAAPDADAILSASGHLRCVYVWHVPGPALPAGIREAVAGVLGPVRFDGSWSLGLLSRGLPGASSHSLGALLELVGDPRRASAAFAAVEALVGSGWIDADSAVDALARSHGLRPRRTSRRSNVDPSLAMTDHDLVEMIGRAGSLAAQGARVLFWGPPAGGKTVLASALCEAMLTALAGDGPVRSRSVVVVTAQGILSGRWGRTERLLAARFEAASEMSAPIFVDEFDAFCGVRSQAGEDSNNGQLTRSLTDAWLRDLDAYPEVPVVAACNSLSCIDGAALRRFHFVVRVDAGLSPDRERRAWAAIAGCPPPDGWRPIGAALGDIASAVARCRMLGRDDPRSLAEAVALAMSVRAGAVPRQGRRLH